MGAVFFHKTVYYSLADSHVIHILAQGMEHILE